MQAPFYPAVQNMVRLQSHGGAVPGAFTLEELVTQLSADTGVGLVPTGPAAGEHLDLTPADFIADAVAGGYPTAVFASLQPYNAGKPTSLLGPSVFVARQHELTSGVHELQQTCGPDGTLVLLWLQPAKRGGTGIHADNTDACNQCYAIISEKQAKALLLAAKKRAGGGGKRKRGG